MKYLKQLYARYLLWRADYCLEHRRYRTCNLCTSEWWKSHVEKTRLKREKQDLQVSKATEILLEGK